MTSVTAPANFTKLGLIPPLLAQLTDRVYQQSTPIQAQIIRSVLAGLNLLLGQIPVWVNSYFCLAAIAKNTVKALSLIQCTLTVSLILSFYLS
jgi:hypothetical protein